MGRLGLHEREAVRALWRAVRGVAAEQREYCDRHGLSLKGFGNWHSQLKREDVAGGDARWGRHPRLRHMVSLMATPWPTCCVGSRHSADTTKLRACRTEAPTDSVHQIVHIGACSGANKGPAARCGTRTLNTGRGRSK